MKFNKVLIMLFVIMNSFSYAQNGTANATSNKNYMIAESYGNSNYACSITFKKKNRDSVFAILNTYFVNSEISKKKTIWKNHKEINTANDEFYVELKQSSLKIEWKNNKSPSAETVQKLKKISAEIVNVVK